MEEKKVGANVDYVPEPCRQVPDFASKTTFYLVAHHHLDELFVVDLDARGAVSKGSRLDRAAKPTTYLPISINISFTDHLGNFVL